MSRRRTLLAVGASLGLAGCAQLGLGIAALGGLGYANRDRLVAWACRRLDCSKGHISLAALREQVAREVAAESDIARASGVVLTDADIERRNRRALAETVAALRASGFEVVEP